jgi:drug/metabolite transporter (DMT)-like permease
MAALITAALLWGTSTSLTKYLLDVFPPITLLIIELALVNLFLWPVVALRRRARRPVRPALGRLALLGLLEPAFTYGGQTVGLTATSAANASLLASFEAPFVVLLCVILLRERPGRRRLLGVILAVVGLAVLDDVRHLFALNIGDLFILGGAMAAAAYSLLASHLAGELDPLEMTAYQFAFGLLFTVPVWLTLYATGWERLSSPIEPRHWVVVVVLACAEFAVSYVLFNFAVRAIPPGSAAMTLNVVPVFGVLAAIVLLDERLAVSQVVGAVLIIGGTLAFSDPGRPVLRPT